MPRYIPDFSDLHERLSYSRVLSREWRAPGASHGEPVHIYKLLCGTLMAFKGRAATSEMLGLNHEGLSDDQAEVWLKGLLPEGSALTTTGATGVDSVAQWLFQKAAPVQLEQSKELARAKNCKAVFHRVEEYLSRGGRASEMSTQLMGMIRYAQAGGQRLYTAHMCAVAALLGEMASGMQDGLTDLQEYLDAVAQTGGPGSMMTPRLPPEILERLEERLSLACRAVDDGPRGYPVGLFLRHLLPNDLIESVALGMKVLALRPASPASATAAA